MDTSTSKKIIDRKEAARMALQVSNSLTRKKESINPIVPDEIGMYVCGPTVYNNVHLGNVRTFVSFDVIYRYLKYIGFKVKYIRNITDVGHLVGDVDSGGEDKIGRMARRERVEPMQIVQRYMNDFHEMMRIFNNLKPDIEPRATGHIHEQIAMVQEILDRGYAYEVNGTVYFDTVNFSKDYPYGELSGRKIDELMANSRDDLKNQDEKRHPSDFALWLKAAPDHILRWPSPWSDGFPGWHLECSVMSTKYLGKTFDIHGGGNDLKFPHHENEVAQNLGSCGCTPANYWLHSNMLLMNGRKMSKSDDNSITPNELFTGDSKHISKSYTPMVLRFFMLQSHYTSTLDLSDDALQAAEKGYKRLFAAYNTLQGLISTNVNEGSLDGELNGLLDSVIEDMNDDFNTPRAISRFFDLASKVNSFEGGHLIIDDVGQKTLNRMKEDFSSFLFDVFGLQDDLQGGESSNSEALDDLMKLVIKLRNEARTKKDFATADQIRDTLNDIGIELKDGKNGTKWSL